MKIRRASKKDWSDILKLIQQHPDVLVQDHLPRPSEFFIAVEKEEAVGCCALEVYSKRLAEVRSLAVSAAHQGKGIATKLIDRCVRDAKKRDVRELLTITSATKLFERHGFNALRKEKYALLRPLN
jgi:N-acetylglutamate synthase-like GNAT family acetyltransferase